MIFFFTFSRVKVFFYFFSFVSLTCRHYYVDEKTLQINMLTGTTKQENRPRSYLSTSNDVVIIEISFNLTYPFVLVYISIRSRRSSRRFLFLFLLSFIFPTLQAYGHRSLDKKKNRRFPMAKVFLEYFNRFKLCEHRTCRDQSKAGTIDSADVLVRGVITVFRQQYLTYRVLYFRFNRKLPLLNVALSTHYLPLTYHERAVHRKSHRNRHTNPFMGF